MFGELAANPGISPTSSPVVYGFTGHMVDLESGLNRTEYRQYNPAVGRWLTHNPIGFDSKDLNYYRYVFNQPLKYTDPDGRCAWAILDLIANQAVKYCGKQLLPDNITEGAKILPSTATQQQEDDAYREGYKDWQRRTYGGYTPDMSDY